MSEPKLADDKAERGCKPWHKYPDARHVTRDFLPSECFQVVF